MKKSLLAFLVALGMSLPMFAESSYTIEFKTSTSDSSTALSATTYSAQIESGAEYVSGFTCNNVYAGIKGLKFSSSKANGAMTLTLSAEGQVNATRIVVEAVKYGSDAASVAVNDETAQSLTADLEDYTFSLTGSKLEEIVVSATKRMYLKSVTVYYDESGVEKSPAGLSYAQTSFTVFTGDSFEAPELINPNGLSVEYTSSNEGVATVASDGSVTIVDAGTTTIKAIFEGNDAYYAGEASYTLTVVGAASSIAEMIEKAPNKDDKVYVNFPMTVTYVNGQNVYVTDGKGGYTLLYKANSYEALDIIPAGWEAKYSPYNGLPEFVPTASSFPAAEGKGTFVPRTMSLSEVSAANVNEVIIITDVEFKEATLAGSSAKNNFTGYDGDATLSFRNNFADLPSVEAGKYDVTAVPALYNGSLQVYPISYEAIPKMNAEISWSAATAEATIGQDFTSPVLVNPNSLTVAYSTSNAEVATVNEEGQITLVAAGTAVITATFAGNVDYNEAAVSYTLTVNPRIKTNVALTWSATEAEGTIGKDFTAPALTVTPEEAKSAVVFTSSDTAVATISAQGGVELVGEGTAVIKAAIADNEYYNDTEATYTLTVNPAIVQIATSMSYSASEVTAVMHQAFTAPELTVTPSAAQSLVKFASSNTEVATIDAQGVVTIEGIGTATITATIEETENFGASTASYVITVEAESTTLSWSETEYIAVLGEDFTAPELTVAPEAAKALVAYSSSNTEVATITAEGEITLLSAGETTITASIEEGDGYKASSASYKLIVEAPAPETTAEVTFDFVNETYGMTRLSGTTQEYNPDGMVIENGEVIGKLNNNTRLWSDGLRFYKDSKITLSAPSEGNIVKVEFASKAASSFDFTPESEDTSANTIWTGSSKEVVISTNVTKGNAAISSIIVTYDLVSDPNKGKAELSFPESSYTAVLGNDFESPVLVNPHSLSVVYESANPEVATVNENGEVTILESGLTTISAIFEGNDEYNPGSASYDLTVIEGASSIADMLRMGNDDATARIAVNTSLTVTYVSGMNVYVTDGTDFTLLYGNNSYEALDIIPAGWVAMYAPYGGLDEFKPATTFPAATGKGEFTAREVTLKDIDNEMINEVVLIKDVTFDEATPADKSNFTGTDGDENMAFRNNFVVASVEAGTYDVLGAIAIYNGTLQVYPIEYTEVESLPTPKITFEVNEIKTTVSYPFSLAKAEVDPAGIELSYFIKGLEESDYTIEEDDEDLIITVKRAGRCELVAFAAATETTKAAEATVALVITPDAPDVFVDGEATSSSSVMLPESGALVVTATAPEGVDIYYAILEDLGDEPEYKLMPKEGVDVSDVCTMLILSEVEDLRSNPVTINFTPYNAVSTIFAEGVRVEGNDIIAPEGAMVFDLAGRNAGFRGLSAGIYVVVFENKRVKVMVK